MRHLQINELYFGFSLINILEIRVPVNLTVKLQEIKLKMHCFNS